MTLRSDGPPPAVVLTAPTVPVPPDGTEVKVNGTPAVNAVPLSVSVVLVSSFRALVVGSIAYFP